VLEPQGTLFFLLLMVSFGALVLWAALAKQIVFRVFAACLAFLPAMVFGIAAVNKYYDYYETWGSMFSDITNSSTVAYPKFAAAGLTTGSDIAKVLQEESSQGKLAGYTISLTVTGPKSHITRDVLVYLPPQYFMPQYKHYRFPAIELLHGSPGEPIDWIDVLDVEDAYLGLLDSGAAKPAILVMPDTDGGEKYSLQCLNNPAGIQDMTFVAREVPEAVYHLVLRVQPPGRAWGVAGYSEGGYCAANIALNNPGFFGYSGVISGYFSPLTSQVPENNKPGGKPIRVNVFADYPALKLKNTPTWLILHEPGGDELPQFWIAAGVDDKGDVEAAEQFRQLVSLRQVDVPLDLVPGGHTGKAWRAALSPMLSWMTPLVAAEANAADQAAAQKPHEPQRVRVATPKSAKPAPRPSKAKV
jgi:enterochelin esterase-like enzyme